MKQFAKLYFLHFLFSFLLFKECNSIGLLEPGEAGQLTTIPI